MIECHVINLDDRPDRLARIVAALDAARVPFTRFAAVDGRGAPRSAFPLFDDNVARSRYGRALSTAEMGCFLSHVGVAERFLAGPSQCALVLEDDALPPVHLADLCGELVAVLDRVRPANWNLVNIGKCATTRSSYLARLSMSDKLMIAHEPPLTTGAILWSRPGAAHFVAAARAPHAPVDQFICDLLVGTGRAYAFEQAPVEVQKRDSDIGGRFGKRVASLLRPWQFQIKSRRLKANARRADAALRACEVPSWSSARENSSE